MHLENISLVNFKNYREGHFEFCPSINCILGANGSGKTNLLDAIHYLALTKSFLTVSDQQNIKIGMPYFAIRGKFYRGNEPYTVTCRLKQNEKKELSLEENPYRRNSDHVGEFPVVLITPNDTDMIRGNNEIRRKFFDSFLSQLDRHYLQHLLKYNHALRQRNSLLKMLAGRPSIDNDLFEKFNQAILESGQKIHALRHQRMGEIHPVFQDLFEMISRGLEKVDIRYHSDLDRENFPDWFYSSIEKDLHYQRTTLGIHMDEYEFLLDGISLKKYGSQGQQKSFLIALKLAQFEIIHRSKAIQPVLLLDDIFDKLDDQRIEQLLFMMNKHNFGQIFITDARPERTLNLVSRVREEKKFIYL